MKESIYIETSLIGYLTARPNNNLVFMANQEITRRWWNTRRGEFMLYISSIVLDEAAKGDSEMVEQRLRILEDLPVLELTEEVKVLGSQFLAKSNLPPRASDDAIHIATATIHNVDYLLTWNCKHIANAQIQKKLAQICLDLGYSLPIMCTPYELMGE
jgi:predicted nucleic acid-binding protein